METKNFNNNVNGNINSTYVSNQNTIQNTPQNIDWEGTPWMERKPSHPERIITIGSSCSGIGAMEHAIEGLGLRSFIQFAGDIDKNVKKSYFANYPITEDRWHNDLFKFDATKYKGKISIFMAGICCQTFSKAGSLKGVEDETRGQLFKAFCRVIRECEPKMWVMENVDNMLTSNGGRDWNIIKSAFDELGYDIHYQVLNALDYGLPQNRNRLFVIGFKESNPDFKFPAPIELKECIRDYLNDTTPAYRKLSPRETLNLQGFSEDFKMVVPDYAVYHQAGNSIAVPVLKAIFSQIDLTKYGLAPEELGLTIDDPMVSADVEDITLKVKDMKDEKNSVSTQETGIDFKSEMERLKSEIKEKQEQKKKLECEIEDKQGRLNKLVSEFENRKRVAINNWKRHMEQVMEDTKVLIELGVDPSSLSFEQDDLSGDNKSIAGETGSQISEETNCNTSHEIIVDSDNHLNDSKEQSTTARDIEITDLEEVEYPMLTPFYKLWKLKINKEKKEKKKEKVKTDFNPVTGIGMVRQNMVPFYKLYADGPIHALLKIGNEKYKSDYPDPEEGRILSADGYLQTLTFTHSDCNMWIGPKYDENGNMIAPVVREVGEAA